MVCCVYHDRQRVWRDVMREYEWYFEDRPHTADFLKFDVLVTTYDTLIGDFDIIGQLGNGSFGTVYKCLSRLDGCMYAVKAAKRKAKGVADRDRMLKEVCCI